MSCRARVMVCVRSSCAWKRKWFIRKQRGNQTISPMFRNMQTIKFLDIWNAAFIRFYYYYFRELQICDDTSSYGFHFSHHLHCGVRKENRCGPTIYGIRHWCMHINFHFDGNIYSFLWTFAIELEKKNGNAMQFTSSRWEYLVISVLFSSHLNWLKLSMPSHRSHAHNNLNQFLNEIFRNDCAPWEALYSGQTHKHTHTGDIANSI